MVRTGTCAQNYSMLRGAQSVLRLSLRARSTAAAANAPPVDDVTSAHALSAAKPYHEIPGPKALPLVGNTWRFIKGMGNYATLDFVQLQKQMREEYGDIVRLSGIHGRCDQVFLFNPESVEKVLRNDGRFPYRDGPGSMHYYRTVLRKDRFKGVAGTMTTQGEEWQKFRTKVNQPLMHPRSALRYLGNINDVADEFLDKIGTLLDHNKELPHDFMKEFHKWSRLIDAAHTVFECFLLLDFTPSLWRYVSTPAWRRFVRAMDTFTE
ncbi:Cytochrome P450 CYP301A1 [Gryllus bimaculatus]|nr:Cytochrome P450 CYP301A1 [Gryllus bimaculatus]